MIDDNACDRIDGGRLQKPASTTILPSSWARFTILQVFEAMAEPDSLLAPHFMPNLKHHDPWYKKSARVFFSPHINDRVRTPRT